ncbi:hypothetical protein [Arthrobacter rhombi]|uniref:hypothetical protein n=1 Tax=Arthrobacter rhombi TaxID=71253 RepID=UPI003FD60DD4
MLVEDCPGHGLRVELPGLDGYFGGFGGAGMTPGDVFDGVVDGGGAGGSAEELEDGPLDPEEEPGSEGCVEDGGGVVGSVLGGSVVGSTGSVGFVDSDGSGVSVGSVGCEDSLGSVVICGSVGSGGVVDGDSEPVAVVVLNESAAPSGDVSAAEAGRMPREPTSIRVPTRAAQRRVEHWFEPGAVARIRLLH